MGQKKGGPYTKFEQRNRRDEVYRLHFEYEYSSRKISESLKINRNTILRDIQFWYNQVANNFNEIDPTLAIIRQITKLENQKTRLREYLDQVDSIHEKLAIEKLLFGIDSKIIHIRIRIRDSSIEVHDKATKWLNEFMKKNNKNQRYLTLFNKIKVLQKANE